MSAFKVYKFGGTSVGNAEIIHRATEIIRSNNTKTMVVVSAMGGTTDKLLHGARQSALGDLSHSAAATSDFHFRHSEAIDALIHNSLRRASLERFLRESAEEYEAICQSLKILQDFTARILDVTVARGERMMAKIVAGALDEQGCRCAFIDPTEIIFVERRAGIMVPNNEACLDAVRKRLLPLFESNDIVVMPGFFGSGADGELVTLGRGGSDYSATIIAALLKAESVTLFKEVDGLLTADPKFVKNARVIPQLHFREAAELAYYGAKVLHPRTIIPLLQDKIPLIIKNSFNPQYPGTTISNEVQRDSYPVKALTAIRGQTLITVEGSGMLGVPGIAGRIFSALATQEISISVISQASSEANICFVVPEEERQKAITALNNEFRFEIQHNHINSISDSRNLAVIAVVGMGMKGTPGIAARTFSALAKREVNVVAIAQGSSEFNISFVIDNNSLESSLQALHDEFQLEKLRALPSRAGIEAHVNIFGFGQIGTTLAKQISEQSEYFAKTMGITCSCISIADRSGIAVAEGGFTAEEIEHRINKKKSGQSLFSESNPRSLMEVFSEYRAKVFALPAHKGILVDVTAEDTAPLILDALKHKVHVVLANKKPLAVEQDLYDELFRVAKENGVSLRYEATVGAGLPILDTIEKLESSGDCISEITGCLSGTLGYLMTRLEDGVSFSNAVQEAFTAGYTEPDPREDLSGLDVARKGLILLRRLRYRMNLCQVSLEPLFPEHLSDNNPEKFIKKLKSLDESFADRIYRAAKENCVLRYVARLSEGRLTVGIEAVPQASPLGRLRGAGNQVTIKTKRYDANPLVVSGPGAGAEVTAAGVLNDILAIAVTDNNYRKKIE